MERNIRKIRVRMVDDWKDYAKDYPMGMIDENGTSMDDNKKSDIWHVLLSNCHKYSNWLEVAIENCIENNKTELMIMDDT